MQKRNAEMAIKAARAEAERKEALRRQRERYSGPIFSWRNEKGNKVYSNVGFPQDRPYTEATIEYK
ncbi:hypothetical protein [Desulfobulbus propionicus]|uniref:hypothetical protein n=1 Tax=Desulfobulbus propionicus TaxID=894 RepID=UPI00146F0E02|nr:hypothetical protein [Desulfobulbus propionicus]